MAWQLEEAGHRVLFQAWDFVAGSHWTSQMEEGIAGAGHTLAILSRSYLGSVYGRAEWQAAYHADPRGLRRKLIPVRVEDCDRPGLLGEVVSFDLFGRPADAARQHLLDTISHTLAGRAKPSAPPAFPTPTPPSDPPATEPAFPGAAVEESVSVSSAAPRVSAPSTERPAAGRLPAARRPPGLRRFPRTPAKPSLTTAWLSRIGLRRRRALVITAAVLVVATCGTVLAINAAPGGSPGVTGASHGNSPQPTPAYTSSATQPTFSLLQFLRGAGGAVTSVAFSRDGHILANGNDTHEGRGTLQLWDLADPSAPKPIGAPLQSDSDGVASVAFSLNGILASGGNGGTVQLRNVAEPDNPLPGKPLRCDKTRVHAVAFSPDGKTLVCGGDDGTTLLWNVTTPSAPSQIGTPLKDHSDTTGAVYAVAFSPKGNILATASTDGRLRLWDAGNPAPGQLPNTSQQVKGGGIHAVAFSRDGRTLATGDGETARLWDVSTRPAPSRIGVPLSGHDGPVYAVAFSPDGKILATGGNDGKIRLWDVSTRPAPSRIGVPLSGHDGPV
ncbi:TIR domain-containing protein, partial [Frankia sp. Cpl3]|nr:TIR domain-containing protein [Frankia sp. Cpl3]